jgi:hypothetical protein
MINRIENPLLKQLRPGSPIVEIAYTGGPSGLVLEILPDGSALWYSPETGGTRRYIPGGSAPVALRLTPEGRSHLAAWILSKIKPGGPWDLTKYERTIVMAAALFDEMDADRIDALARISMRMMSRPYCACCQICPRCRQANRDCACPICETCGERPAICSRTDFGGCGKRYQSEEVVGVQNSNPA